MFALLLRIVRYMVGSGSLTLIGPDGTVAVAGDGSGDPVVVRIRDNFTVLQLLVDPDLYLGEAYMNGRLEIERGSVYDLLALVNDNLARLPTAPPLVSIPWVWRRLLRRIHQYNPTRRARRNVAHHYDLSGRIYDLFLDRDRQYSCAYFAEPNLSLEEAQLAKKRHLASKLAIEPGMKVLDIGSGWGGLGLYLAEVCGAEVVGITLSREQHKVSNQRAHQRGVASRVQFKLMDYRQIEDRFDRIVSVGMFEHVGVNHYREFFAKLRTLLKEDGVALLHSIGRAQGPGATSAWINKYIFPGGYIPALSEVLPAIEKEHLYITDIEILRLHYAQTLREWRRRFSDHREQAKAIYDERFCRMWEFYLAGSETAFRFGGMNNFQIQFARHQHALPLTRDYMGREEQRLMLADPNRPRLKSVPAE